MSATSIQLDSKGQIVEPKSTSTTSPEGQRNMTAHAPDGAMSINMAGGDAVKKGTVRLNMAHVERPTGILASARTQTGRATSDLTPQTLVMINGRETTLAVAQHLGYVSRDEQGRYVETPEQQRAEREAARNSQQDKLEDAPESFADADAEAVLAEMIQQVPTHTQHSLVNTYVQGKEPSVAELHDLSKALGVPESEVTAAIGAVFDSFKGQADKFAVAQGVNADDVENAWEWLRANKGDELRNAMRQQAYSRSSKVYGELIQTYLRSVKPSAEALAAEGVKVSTRDGAELINIKGMQMTVATAARLGLI